MSFFLGSYFARSPKTWQFGLETRKHTYESINGATQQKVYQFPRWACSASWTLPVSETNAGSRILTRMQYMTPVYVRPRWCQISTGVTGTMTITESASIGANAVQVGGHTGTLKGGSYIRIDGQLHMTWADRSGAGAITVTPPLRQPIAAGTPVEYIDPYVLMRPVDTTANPVTQSEGIVTVSLDLIEVI